MRSVNILFLTKGFTFIESLVGVAVFMIIAGSIYQSYTVAINVIRNSRLKITATALANEQFEIVRNLPYSDVGIVSGLPAGKIPLSQSLTRDGTIFVVLATIRNIDDPFDGTFGGAPNDLSPADHKLVEITIKCPTCQRFLPLRFTTRVSPRALESASMNGALFIHTFDEAGLPVMGADVQIVDTAPAFIINDTTNNQGLLQVVDAPPGFQTYQINVSKPGYSTDQTYTVGAVDNPNPTKPHATVVTQALTEISFAIDKTSTINASTINTICAAIPDINFSLIGTKLIGTIPDVIKYTASHTTDGAGKKTIANLEYDTYNIAIANAVYDLRGTIPLLPMALHANITQDLKLILAPKDPQTLFVIVKDSATQLPLSDVSVQLQQGMAYDVTLITGQGFMLQTDWSGGPGQTDFINPSKYFSDDGNIEVAIPPGDLRLRKIFGIYAPSGILTSSTFDPGAISNFRQILWQPQSQAVETGPDSIRFQIATNNDNATWNFLGPDGTGATYYTLASQNINPIHNATRYLRYKIFLQTADTQWTPIISDISFTYTSSCLPPGQVSFNGLDAGNYTITVSKIGYTTFTETISLSSPWEQKEVILAP